MGRDEGSDITTGHQCSAYSLLVDDCCRCQRESELQLHSLIQNGSSTILGTSTLYARVCRMSLVINVVILICSVN